MSQTIPDVCVTKVYFLWDANAEYNNQELSPALQTSLLGSSGMKENVRPWSSTKVGILEKHLDPEDGEFSIVEEIVMTKRLGKKIVGLLMILLHQINLALK